MRKRFLLVFNPTAGLAGRRLIDRVKARLEARGATVVTAPQGQGEPDLSPLDEQPFDAIIAAGGDGTFRAIAKSVGTHIPVGILPMGTGNVLACEVGLPRSAESLAEVLMTGPEMEIEGARANGEPFYVMAGTGFDGEVIARLNSRLKQRVGKASYMWPVVRALAQRQPRLQVEVDGANHTAGWVVVAKASHYGGSFVIAPNAGIRSRGLVAVLFKSSSRLVLLRQLLALPVRLLRFDPAIEWIPCVRVRIRSENPCAVEIDGDEFGATPLHIEAGEPHVRLIVPARFAS